MAADRTKTMCYLPYFVYKQGNELKSNYFQNWTSEQLNVTRHSKEQFRFFTRDVCYHKADV